MDLKTTKVQAKEQGVNARSIQSPLILFLNDFLLNEFISKENVMVFKMSMMCIRVVIVCIA